MSTTATPKPGRQLWGNYHTGRECLRVTDDPLLLFVQATPKLVTDKVPSPLGFSASWTPKQYPSHQQGFPTRTYTQYPHLIMQTPTTTEIRTAIQVLKKFGEHINNDAANEVIRLHESPHSDQLAARIERRMIDQITRVETVVVQLENWHDKLLQVRSQSVSQRIYDRTSLTP